MGQRQWRFCEQCASMSFDGRPNKGVCPAGGGHRAEGFVFVLPHLPPVVAVPDPSGTPVLLPDTGSPGVEALRPLFEADDTFTSKVNALGGLPGRPMIPGLDGVMRLGSGFFREYAHGNIYLSRTVSNNPFYVGRARHRYSLLGGPNSFLGWPISDDEFDPVEPGSGITRFQHGAIYFFDDIGDFEMQHVALRFVGFRCVNESDEPSASDEPYFVFGVVSMNGQSSTPRTGIFEDVDAGDTRDDNIELYRGLPLGVILSVILAEHDFGDADRFKDQVSSLVDKAATKVGEALAESLIQVHPIGIVLGPITNLAIILAAPELASAINELFDTEDDQVAQNQITLTGKELIRLTRVAPQDFDGISAHVEVPLQGEDAAYLAYFVVEAVPPA